MIIFGITDQFGWQNIVAPGVGVTIEPRRRWGVTGQYLKFLAGRATGALWRSTAKTKEELAAWLEEPDVYFNSIITRPRPRTILDVPGGFTDAGRPDRGIVRATFSL